MRMTDVQTYDSGSFISEVGGFSNALYGSLLVITTLILYQIFIVDITNKLKEEYESGNIVSDEENNGKSDKPKKDLSYKEINKQLKKRLSYQGLFKLFDRVEHLEEVESSRKKELKDAKEEI